MSLPPGVASRTASGVARAPLVAVVVAVGVTAATVAVGVGVGVGVGVAARAAAGGVAVIGVAVPAGQVRACTRASARTAVGMMAAAAAAAAAGQAAAAAAAARTAAVVLSVLAARGGAPSVAATSRTTLPADQRVLPVAPAPTADEGTVGVAAHVAAEGGASRRRSVMTRCGRACPQGPSLCLYAASAR